MNQPGQHPDPYGAARNPNPYAPPSTGHDPWTDTNINLGPVEPEGNYWAGFAIGFFFALLGLIIVYVVAKPETKRGSLHGFGTRLGVVVLLTIVSLMIGS